MIARSLEPIIYMYMYIASSNITNKTFKNMYVIYNKSSELKNDSVN